MFSDRLGKMRCLKKPQNSILRLLSRNFHQFEMMRKRVTSWLKPHSTPATMKWLEGNYQPAIGVCVPRNTLYREYVEFCRLNQMQPVNAASFGKIIRKKFPHLTTRRLGTRGQSKYHYYGLMAKFDFQSVAGVSTNAEVDLHLDDRIHRSTMMHLEHLGHPLWRLTDAQNITSPQFPSREIFDYFPKRPLSENLETVLELYTAHCQRVFDKANIYPTNLQVCEEIKEFWETFPIQLMPLLQNNSVLTLIVTCDTILYCKIGMNLDHFQFRTIKDSPPPLHTCKQMIHLAINILSCTSEAMKNFNDNLRKWKLRLAQQFVENIKSQASLQEIYGTFQTYITEEIHYRTMIMDSKKLDLICMSNEATSKIISTLSVSSSFQKDFHNVIFSRLCELLNILTTKSRSQIIKNLFSWSQHVTLDISNIKTKNDWSRHVDSFQTECPKRLAIRHYLLVWSILGESLLNKLQSNSATSYAVFESMYFLLKKNSEQILRSVASIDLISKLIQTIITGESNLEVLWNSVNDYSHSTEINSRLEINPEACPRLPPDALQNRPCKRELYSQPWSEKSEPIAGFSSFINRNGSKDVYTNCEGLTSDEAKINGSIYFDDNLIPYGEVQLDLTTMARPMSHFMQMQLTENEELEEFQRTIENTEDIISASVANHNLQVNHQEEGQQINTNLELQQFPNNANQSELEVLEMPDQQPFARRNYFQLVHPQSQQQHPVMFFEQNCQISSCYPHCQCGTGVA